METRQLSTVPGQYEIAFPPMAPEADALYQSLMEHADNCMQDVQTHKRNVAIHAALYGSAFPSLKRMGQLLVQEFSAMEMEARDLAYLVLTSGTTPGADDGGCAQTTTKSPKPRPYYRPGRW